MIFKRLLMPMLVLGIIFTMGNMAYAQSTITCSIVSGAGDVSGGYTLLGPSTRATATGHTEPIGAGPDSIPPAPGDGRIRIKCQNTGPAVNPGVVVLSITFQAPITNAQLFPTTGVPGAAGIRVVNGTGDFVAFGPGAGSAPAAPGSANVGISSVTPSGGLIVIGLGKASACQVCGAAGTSINPTTGVDFSAGTPAAPSLSSFDLAGVLLSTNGKTGAVSATLTSTGGVNVGIGAAEVITSVVPGLSDPSVPASLPTGVSDNVCGVGVTCITGGAAVLNAVGTALKGNFTIRIPEAYEDMFKESLQFNGGGTFPASPASDTQVFIVFSGVPGGLNIGPCTPTLTDANGVKVGGVGPTTAETNVTSASPVLTVNFNAPVAQDAIDVLWITCVVGAGSATLPLPSTPVTAKVTLGPTGAALSATSTILTGLTTGQIPRYQENLLPANGVTIIVFPPSQTTLLVSLAAVTPGYNTGISVANTTADPYGVGGGGAAASAGTLTYWLYKSDGTSASFTTGAAGTPAGNGSLSAAGVLAAGRSYLVNVSELLAVATPSLGTTFTGYVFVTANFTHAHGAATIYTTTNGSAALSSPVLVLPAVSSATPRVSPESGGQ